MHNIKNLKNFIKGFSKDRLVIYSILLIVLIVSLYLFFDILIWLRIQAFIISQDIIINSKYALELSIIKNEKIVYNFFYSPKTKSILYYWIYGENTKKAYLLPQLLPSGIKAESPTKTYTFYFENGKIYPEGEIIISTYLSKRTVKFYKNGKVKFD
ncbi:MAG: hypothetical protein NZ841_04680 [Dictyoglomus sp.]|nr:hypothetical protein [Dictyoglomus sp.]MDW8188572.1 hypothetical protein [Dictyoglomus sp.]